MRLGTLPASLCRGMPWRPAAACKVARARAVAARHSKNPEHTRMTESRRRKSDIVSGGERHAGAMCTIMRAPRHALGQSTPMEVPSACSAPGHAAAAGRNV